MAGRTRSSIHKRRQWRRISVHLTWGVLVLQVAMLTTLATSRPLPRPPRVKFFELIWAWLHEPHFYPLAALVFLGVPLSIMASCVRGVHRFFLAIAWVIFALIIIIHYPHRFSLMLRALYWAMQYP